MHFTLQLQNSLTSGAFTLVDCMSLAARSRPKIETVFRRYQSASGLI
jgi:hypothetical protein